MNVNATDANSLDRKQGLLPTNLVPIDIEQFSRKVNSILESS
jgi:hypothetical protein